MTKKSGTQSGNQSGSQSGSQSSRVYSYLIRRTVPAGDTKVRSNSVSLNSIIESDHLPREFEYIPAKPPKNPLAPWKPGKTISRPGNADDIVVQNARRHQMRLSTHMDTRYQPKQEEKRNVQIGQTKSSIPPWEKE